MYVEAFVNATSTGAGGSKALYVVTAGKTLYVAHLHFAANEPPNASGSIYVQGPAPGEPFSLTSFAAGSPPTNAGFEFTLARAIGAGTLTLYFSGFASGAVIQVELHGWLE